MTPTPVSKLIVPRAIYERSWRFLRADGERGVESGVVWGGRRFGAVGIVVAVLYPSGSDVLRAANQYRVGPDTAARIGQWLTKHGCRALAQVHTHPAEWVGHSRADDNGPIVSADGFVSVVWPDFARDLPPIHALGVHVRVNGSWKRFMHASAGEVLELVDDEAIIDGNHRRRPADDLQAVDHE